MPNKSTYTADSIETLEGLEAVRKRPGMYIGGTGSEGLMHLVWELIDNAVDEAAAGFATAVNVVLNRDSSVSVSDNGRGIPIGLHAKRKVSALEVVFTELHAGGKFGGGAYSASGGLHGVGASVVNALASKLKVEVDRDGYTHGLSFKERKAGQFISANSFKAGHKLEKIKRVGRKTTGTRVRFWPDFNIFSTDAELDYEEICERLKQACYLVPSMKVSVTDKRGAGKTKPFTFSSTGGLSDLIESMSNESPICKTIVIKGVSEFIEKVPVNQKMTKVTRKCTTEIALRWVDGYDPQIVSFVNTIPTPSGGTHLAGFDKALTRAVNNVLLKDCRKLAKLAKQNNHKATKDDVQEGLIAAIKVTFPEPQFRGQTKHQLGTPSIEGIVSRLVYEQIKAWGEPGGAPRSQVKKVIDKLAGAVVNRVASKTLLETRRKAKKLGSNGMPEKLADCREHGTKSELIVVEGDSAAGPAKRGRDSKTMAILPLRGKVVNAYKATPKQVLDNAEARALFTAMGAGMGTKFDLESARYGRLIILCDADVDGSHIRCLLLTLIYKYMTPLLQSGHVYAAQPPLFTTKVGDKTFRAFSEDEKASITKKLTNKRRSASSITWQRFKGLGEMNVDELRHCALDPETRTLRRLTMKDGAEAEAASAMFAVLMGSDVGERRDYVVNNSALVDSASIDI